MIVRIAALALLGCAGSPGAAPAPTAKQPATELLAPASEPAAGEVAGPAGTAGTAAASTSLIIPRGEGEVSLTIPRDEELTYRVIVDAGLLGDVEAGSVVLSSGAMRYVAGLPPAGGAPAPAEELETAWIRSVATGSYAGYSVRHELSSRILPQKWPRILYNDHVGGSDHRRRELKLGEIDGKEVAVYRGDGHCKGCDNPEHFLESRWVWGKPYHCAKCKLAEHRVWREPKTRDVPAGALDMLSAIYLARTLVSEHASALDIALVDKQKLWNVHLARGRRRDVETPAGRFACVEIELASSVPPGEPVKDERFQGLFGLQGSIRIFAQEASGVPVLIRGEFPVPVLGDLDVSVELTRYRGTAPSFAATGASASSAARSAR